MLVREYKIGYEKLKNTNLFNPEELSYVLHVYENLVSSSLKSLDELLNVVTASQLRMSDDERLGAIDAIYAEMEDNVSFLREFNNNNAVLAFQRRKEKSEINSAEILNGLNPNSN
jgi:hypothetical protein